MSTRPASAPARFQQLADDITASIEGGVLRAGDRLPSIRAASQTRRMSVTTVKRAYGLLESRGLVESRPQSGFYVRARPMAKGRPATPAAPWAATSCADATRIVLSTLRAIGSREVMPFGSPFPDPELFPWGRMRQRINEVARGFSAWDPLHDVPPGQPELIREIARRHLINGLDVGHESILVTAGATEAIDLCLQAVTRPGGAVVVESPCYYATLQTIRRLGLRPVEVPVHPEHGIDLVALERVLTQQRIDACVFMPNFQNPLGFVMSDPHKQALVELARKHQVPVIENGAYNELGFGTAPSTLKAFDTDGNVLHCGSFSKCLAAGVRMGWVLPGRHAQRIESLAFLSKMQATGLTQLAVARFLHQDGWDHHLRGVRRTLLQRRDILRAMVQRFFPAGTRVTEPAGGYLLWVELPAPVDTLALHREALAQGIAVTPGCIFGKDPQLRRCLRLNYSYPWTPELEAAFKRLARLVRAATASAQPPLLPALESAA